MSGGVPKRILITQTQRNTPSKAGNPVPKKAIIACSGEKSRTSLCNYVRKRTNVLTPLQTSYSWSTQMVAKDLSVGSLIETAGFSSITLGCITAAGSLTPSGPSCTEILSIYTFAYPIAPPASPPQLIVSMTGVHIPTSITFSGVFADGSHHTFTLRTDEADHTPPSTPNLWIWRNTQIFVIGNTYTLRFN